MSGVVRGVVSGVVRGVVRGVVSIHIHINIYVKVYMYKWICIYVHMCYTHVLRAHAETTLYSQAAISYIFIYIYTCIYIYIYMCVYIHVYIYITRVCIYIYMYIYQNSHVLQAHAEKPLHSRGGGLGSSTIFKNLMSPTPRRKWYLTT